MKQPDGKMLVLVNTYKTDHYILGKKKKVVQLKNANIRHWKYRDIVDMHIFLKLIQIPILLWVLCLKMFRGSEMGAQRVT